mgnify:CR=1 FL=1|jgi:transcriptional regulator with XRE-family HTH domain
MKTKASSMEWAIEDGRNVFAERVIASRLASGLTQKELAILAGVSQQAITNIEKGLSRSNRRLLQLADALGVTPEWLIGWTDDRDDARAAGAAPKISVALVTSAEFREAAAKSLSGFNASQIRSSGRRSIDPTFFVGQGSAGLNATPDLIVQFSPQEYALMMGMGAANHESKDGGAPAPESAAYIVCCTSLSKSSRKYAAMPKLVFHRDTREITLAGHWSSTFENVIAIPYVMTITT